MLFYVSRPRGSVRYLQDWRNRPAGTSPEIGRLPDSTRSWCSCSGSHFRLHRNSRRRNDRQSIPIGHALSNGLVHLLLKLLSDLSDARWGSIAVGEIQNQIKNTRIPRIWNIN